MDNIKKTSLEKAIECFESGLIVKGAEYLFIAYYEQEKSKEILGYFDEFFFKPNVDLMRKIYNENLNKINLQDKFFIFKNLPYYIIPIDETIFFVYDKENNEIISKKFLKEQMMFISLCTDEDLVAEEYLNEYFDEIKTYQLIFGLNNQKNKLWSNEYIKSLELNEKN